MEQVVETAAPVVEESIEAYFTRANDAERTGEPMAETPAAGAAVAETDGDKAPVAAVEPKPEKVAKPRNDPQARIDQAIAKQRETERLAKEATERADRAERELAATRQPKPDAPKPAAAAPAAFPDFASWSAQPDHAQKSYEDYIDARTDWKYDQRQQADRAAAADAHAAQTLTESNTAFRERLSAAIADEPNFLETVDSRLLDAPRIGAYVAKTDASGHTRYFDRITKEALPPPSFASFLVEQVYKSDAPKALLRHLSNEQEVQRLATLPPDEVIRSLAKLEHQASAAASRGPAREPKPKSHAPDPITPLGSSASVPDTDEADDTLETYIHRENARDRKAGRL